MLSLPLDPWRNALPVTVPAFLVESLNVVGRKDTSQWHAKRMAMQGFFLACFYEMGVTWRVEFGATDPMARERNERG